MKKDNQKSLRRERIIMMTSSVFVLGALTLTGVYMRNQTKQSQDDGYTIDFTALEDSANDKLNEIAQNRQTEQDNTLLETLPDADLDYLPMEVGSDDIKIPGLTDKLENRVVDDSKSDGMSDGAGKTGENNLPPAESKTPVEQKPPVEENPKEETPLAQETAGTSPILPDTLHFAADTMVKPVSGEPLINYSMSGTVYFATLDQYKYNPAIVYSAKQGESVGACTTGKVLSIRNDAELGHVMVLDLGDGYQAVYGQLEDIQVPIGAMVDPGMKLASVAAPTKYYSVEGSNLYFQILKDGVSVDPNSFF